MDAFGNNLLMSFLDFAKPPCNLAVVQHILDLPGFELDRTDEYGRLSYFLAAPQTRVWSLLIEKGANLNLLDKEGKSLLHWHLAYNSPSSSDSPQGSQLSDARTSKIKLLLRSNFDLKHM